MGVLDPAAGIVTGASLIGNSALSALARMIRIKLTLMESDAVVVGGFLIGLLPVVAIVLLLMRQTERRSALPSSSQGLSSVRFLDLAFALVFGAALPALIVLPWIHLTWRGPLERRIETSRDAFDRMFANRGRMRILLESSTDSEWQRTAIINLLRALLLNATLETTGAALEARAAAEASTQRLMTAPAVGPILAQLAETQ